MSLKSSFRLKKHISLGELIAINVILHISNLKNYIIYLAEIGDLTGDKYLLQHSTNINDEDEYLLNWAGNKGRNG